MQSRSVKNLLGIGPTVIALDFPRTKPIVRLPQRSYTVEPPPARRVKGIRIKLPRGASVPTPVSAVDPVEPMSREPNPDWLFDDDDDD